MDARTATDDAINRASGKVKGRKDAGQEAIIKSKEVENRIADLVDLHIKSVALKEKLNDAIKAVAEKAGLHASTVAKFVHARAGERFDETNTKIQQLALLFDEVGPFKGSRGGSN